MTRPTLSDLLLSSGAIEGPYRRTRPVVLSWWRRLVGQLNLNRR